ncbi:hypothetical protein GCM10022280_16260 [Sphingomonas swuensis]|uniref:HPr kinase/phosphorylase C-terminal domain-containing protein n=1 Tax=Sphingomonas swuensis TaxID=977800 RepID=A0ABP7SXD4_9SPHN
MALTRARLFGLTIESDMALPGLLAADAHAPTDVTVRRGSIEGEPDLVTEGGNFQVRDGREILIEADSAIPESNIRLYLLGSAMGLILHQRGIFPLHANSVEVAGRAIAVSGWSGAGKSTLAAWFHDRGHRLIGDDVCVLVPGDGSVIAHPGVPRLRLWGEAIDLTGRSREGLERAYAGEEWDKWDVPVDSGVVAEGLALGAIYVLEDAAELAIEPLTGAAAAEALFANTYRGGYVGQAGAPGHWRTVTRLLGLVPMFRLRRPFDLTLRDALGEMLLAHATAAVARTVG